MIGRGLSRREQDVFEAIKSSIEACGVAPSVRGLAATTKMTLGNAHAVLCQLEKKGAIMRGPGPRNTRIVEASDQDAVRRAAWDEAARAVCDLCAQGVKLNDKLEHVGDGDEAPEYCYAAPIHKLKGEKP
jgi:SOS-response transcriptional repressor LexA